MGGCSCAGGGGRGGHGAQRAPAVAQLLVLKACPAELWAGVGHVGQEGAEAQLARGQDTH